MGTDRTRDHLVEVLTAPVAAIGLDVEAIEVTQAGKRRMLRVAVDKDGGVTMDDIADATREVSRLLDGSDVMGAQPYTLEVSSPGVDRPLRRLSHFARHVGGRAVVRTREPLNPGDEQRTFHGRIVGTKVDPSNPEDDRLGTVLLRALDGDTIYPISLAQIRRANLVYEMPGTPGVKN